MIDEGPDPEQPHSEEGDETQSYPLARIPSLKAPFISKLEGGVSTRRVFIQIACEKITQRASYLGYGCVNVDKRNL